MPVELGNFGAWLNPRYSDDERVEFAVEAESLGYRTVWLGGGAEPAAELALHQRVLEATSTVTVASAIINMWNDPAERIGAAYRRIAARHGDRLLLGLGLGHPESTGNYAKPYTAMVDYLDRLDEVGAGPDTRILGALGPKALALAGRRTVGAHPYLTTAEHTAVARRILGIGPLLAPEHKVVVDTDVRAAREIGRPAVQIPYLSLSNYTNNLLRHGFDEDDIAGGGSDRLIDALVLHGDPAEIADGLWGHLVAGADHVGIQVLAPPGQTPMSGFRLLAKSLW